MARSSNPRGRTSRMSVAADRFAVGPALDQPLDFIPKSRWTVLRRIVSQPKGAIGVTLVVVYVLLAVFGPMLAPDDAFAEFRRHAATPLRSALVRHRPARARCAKPCPRRRSRDARDRGWRGRARFLIGVPLGVLAAWRRGWIDAATMRVVDVMLELPGHRVRARHRRDPRSQHAERDRRGGYRVRPGLRPHTRGL